MANRNAATLLALGAIFGSSFLFMRVSAPAVGPLLVAEGRVAIAALALIAIGGRGTLAAIRRDWHGYLVLGAFNVALPFALISYAEVTITASLAGLLNATTPLFVAMVSAVWLRQPLTRRSVVAIAIGFAGVAVLVGWSPLEIAPAMLVAVLASLGAALGYGIGLPYSRRRFPGVSPLTVSTGQVLGATIILALPAALTLPAAVPTPDAIGAIVALGLVCTALAWPLLFRLVAAIGPTATSTVTFLVPGFGIGWGTLLLGESIGPGTLVGFGLVLLSLALVLELRAPAFVRRSTVVLDA